MKPEKINKKWLGIILILASPFVIAGIFIGLAAILKSGALANLFADWAEWFAYAGLWIVPIIIYLGILIILIRKKKTYGWIAGALIGGFTLFPYLLKKIANFVFRQDVFSPEFINLIRDTITLIALFSYLLWPVFLAISLIKYIEKIRKNKLWKVVVITGAIIVIIIELIILIRAMLAAHV